jgi:hypothetical protein
MTYAKIDKLLEAIQDVVSDNGSWQSKHRAIMEHAFPEEITCLLEFVSWFESPFESPETERLDAGGAAPAETTA